MTDDLTGPFGELVEAAPLHRLRPGREPGQPGGRVDALHEHHPDNVAEQLLIDDAVDELGFGRTDLIHASDPRVGETPDYSAFTGPS